MYLKHCGTVRGCSVVDSIDTYVQTLIELLLLLVYYTEAEVDLIGLLERGLHAHDL
jgi:hypothetical protein